MSEQEQSTVIIDPLLGAQEDFDSLSRVEKFGNKTVFHCGRCKDKTVVKEGNRRVAKVGPEDYRVACTCKDDDGNPVVYDVSTAVSKYCCDVCQRVITDSLKSDNIKTKISNAGVLITTIECCCGNEFNIPTSKDREEAYLEVRGNNE